MVFLYIMYFFKNNNIFKKTSIKKLKLRFVTKLKYMLPFFLLALISFKTEFPKTEKISFTVSRNNDSIGYVDIEKKIVDDLTSYIIDSEVNVRVLFNFTAKGHEESVYKKHVMIYSSMYRKLNSRTKLNHSISLKNGNYIFNNKGEESNLNLGLIKNNLATLLYNEPTDITEVYSDKFKRMVKIKSLGNGTYTIALPNKSTSVYHYKNSQCVRVELEGSFYKVDLVRKHEKK